MKAFLVITFLMTLVKSGLWISSGLLVKNYLSILFTPSLSKSKDSELKETRLKTLTNWIGVLLIIVGAFVALTAIMTLTMGLRMPMNNFNFKF